jgi:predicted ATPase
MVGREATVAEISSLLRANRFVSIVGPGGMGKTTVAVAVAHALAESFDNSVHFVDLATVHDQSLVGTAMSSAVGCPVQAEDPLEALLSFAGDKPMLLVLDNCEHLIDGAATAAEWLTRAAPQVSVLTTSREALRAEGENVYLLSPLESPQQVDALTAANALLSPAVQLFMERAAASGHRTPLSDDDAPIVAQICSRLEGIALAIELAASRVGAHGIRGTANLLDNRFRLLWHGRRTALPRHQTLSAMLDWSFNLLSEPEQDTLCRLSVFVGNFTLAAALSVAANTDAEVALAASLIGSLVAKSLVWASHRDGAMHYRLLDATRAYAAVKLVEREEANEIARRHAAYCVRFIPSCMPRSWALAGPDVPHIDEIRAALAWCFSEAGDAGLGIDLAVQSASLFFHLSLLGECKRWAERAMSALREADRNSERELVLLQASATSAMFTLGNSNDIRAAIDRALTLAVRLGRRERELHLLVGLSIFATRIGDFRLAVSTAERCVSVAGQAGDPAGRALAEWLLGVAQNWLGDQAAAQHHCERGFEIAAAAGIGEAHFFGYDQRVRALAALARALWLRGLSPQAVTAANSAVEEAIARGHPIDICFSYIYTFPVVLWIGDLAQAEERIAQLIGHATRFSLAPYRATGDALRGELAIRRGDAATGIQLLRGAIAALNADRNCTLVASFSRALAEALASIGQFDDALVTVRYAIASVVERGGTFEIPDLLRAEGEILLASPQADVGAAEDALSRAIEYARRQSALLWELRAAIPLARLWATQGRASQAHAMLDGVLGNFPEACDSAEVSEARTLRDRLGEAPPP